MAKEAAQGWVLSALDAGQSVPRASAVESVIAGDASYAEAVWAFIDLETSIAA
ncbi:hypothetical protein Pan265_14340 [Mucisphaera calidilacus]|uniref:HicB-like antitoxin of toxin-antitoxin system domain-containing protein n=2 Tax=Mucisphaera calidilacus TaxID=2527982 RepID=A0A518BX89_9BACT|nr:hypothetical protein Pan265_14340 [Mucisphaera calidilacus]